MNDSYLQWLINSDGSYIPLKDKSVHMVVTSPPYWKHRVYAGTVKWAGGDSNCNHEMVRKKTRFDYDVSEKQASNRGSNLKIYKDVCLCGAKKIDAQLGQEPIPDCFGWVTGNWCGECYICHLITVSREIQRVLRDDGTFWLNIGDTYCERKVISPSGVVWKAKDLTGIPWSLAQALRSDGWYLRSPNIWHKPNPMTTSAKDRTTSSHEYVFTLSKKARYFYDHEAIKEPLSQPDAKSKNATNKFKGYGNPTYSGYDYDAENYSTGRNKRDVWKFPTGRYKGTHFAVFPPDLPEICIKAGTSERGVCPDCKAPWKRVFNIVGRFQRRWGTGNLDGSPYNSQDSYQNIYEEIGWIPTCKCYSRTNEWVRYPYRMKNLTLDDLKPISNKRKELVKIYAVYKTIPATVLDMFVGSGTTLVVANSLGRHGIGCDISFSYLKNNAKARLLEEGYLYERNR